MTSPAERVIEKLGGPEEVAAVLKLHVSNVYRWKYPRERGGNDGRVRDDYQQALLDHARAHGIDLTPADFFDTDEAA